MTRFRFCGLAAWALVLASVPARADQYRSETRILDEVPAEIQQKSAEELLKQTTDPYGKALLLRDLATKAAQSGNAAQAAKYIEQALAQNALSGLAAQQMRDQLSQLYMSSGDYKKLVPQLEAQVKGGKPSNEALIALGSAYYEQKRYREALQLVERAIKGAAGRELDPSWRRVYAAVLLANGQEREALPQLEQLLKRDASQREDWMRLVAIYVKTGNKIRASVMLELAGRLGFLTTPDERLQLVMLTAQLGAPFQAASTLQTMMERREVPSNGENWKLLSSLWLAARESGLALKSMDEAIRLAPSAALYQQRAQLHMDREEYAEAAQALDAAIARGASDGNTYMALGMARYQQANVEAAMQAFAKAQQQASSRKLAGDWLKYLESGRAREQALAAASQRRQRSDEQIQLGGLIGGERIVIGAGSGDAGRVVSPAAAGAGSNLTPIGAEAGPSADGSIPAWSGGIARSDWPSGAGPGKRLLDPFPADAPLFTITASNYSRYRERLSAAHQALFARYPTYSMPVYKTRRSVGYPQAIYDASQANIGRSKLLGPDSLAGAHLGVPFPRPQSGVEIMWNHRTRYRGNTVQQQTTQAVVPVRGKPIYLKQTEKAYFRYGNIADPIDLAKKNFLLYYLTWFGASRNEMDFLALVHETANSLENNRDIWVLPPKIPKMFRVPPVGYDQPFPGSEGLMFIDMVDMYNGAFDRYVWKLVGKRELYIPYNSFRIGDAKNKYADMLKPHHFDQNLTRYELHRVWVIEASERSGKRHSFGKRTFYVDEDSWNVVLVENQDREGKPWRFQEGHLLPIYDIQAANVAPMLVYDLQDGRYFANHLSAEDSPPQYDLPMREGDFLPAAVKARYAK
ncbi:MAG TPA: DUF1329 domain-containing protein [Fontimonas sp.]